MGGLETHLHEVAPRIAARGFEVTVLTTDRTGQLPEHEVINGVAIQRVRAWPAKRDYYFAPGIYGVISREPWDLVHCHAYQTLVPPLTMLAAIRSKIPFVVTFHSGGHPSRIRNRLRSIQLRVLRPLLARARKLIAVSEFEAERFPGLLGISRSRFVTIPNGAAIQLPEGRSLPDEDPYLIISVGRLERYKGHHLVIAALPSVIAELPEASLRIVGTGPYEAELLAMAQAAGVSDRVTIGSVDPTDRLGMAELLASAGLVTLLSEYEANPVAIMEALSLNRRVLVAGTSGLNELARRGLAQSVPLDIAPELLGKRIVDQLRSPAPTGFDLPSWDACADRLAAVYREVLRA
jgi:glycosyltransferase involved in cell wall biosynthesis